MGKNIAIRAAVIVAVLVAIALLVWLWVCSQTAIESDDNTFASPATSSETASPKPSWEPGSRPVAEPEETHALSETGESTVKSRSSFGTLEIHGRKIKVADYVDEATLKKSPGWMSDSALPGEDGMCVILGHRNSSHLRVLQNVKIDDEIKFIYSDGREAIYKAADVIIYEKTVDWHLPALDGSTLVLVTCYPFRYSGNAPGKYILVCNMT